VTALHEAYVLHEQNVCCWLLPSKTNTVCMRWLL
jgi:hypothetical protein